MLPRLLLAAIVALLAGCAGTVDPDPEAQERLRLAAAPLLDAHASLDAYQDAVTDGGDYARARALWPEVAADVHATVEAFDPRAATGLGPAQRSTLVGYAGGLRTALALWERAAEAIAAEQAGRDADVDGRVDAARAHMRVLEGLRAGAAGGPRRGGPP